MKTSFSEEYLNNMNSVMERIDRHNYQIKYDGEERYSYVNFVNDLDIIIALSFYNY